MICNSTCIGCITTCFLLILIPSELYQGAEFEGFLRGDVTVDYPGDFRDGGIAAQFRNKVGNTDIVVFSQEIIYRHIGKIQCGLVGMDFVVALHLRKDAGIDKLVHNAVEQLYGNIVLTAYLEL